MIPITIIINSRLEAGDDLEKRVAAARSRATRSKSNWAWGWNQLGRPAQSTKGGNAGDAVATHWSAEKSLPKKPDFGETGPGGAGAGVGC